MIVLCAIHLANANTCGLLSIMKTAKPSPRGTVIPSLLPISIETLCLNPLPKTTETEMRVGIRSSQVRKVCFVPQDGTCIECLH